MTTPEHPQSAGRGEPESGDVTADVAAALDALGESWRGDWSDFDGRTLRHQLNTLSKALRTGEFNFAGWAAAEDICSRCGSWTEHCHGHA